MPDQPGRATHHRRELKECLPVQFADHLVDFSRALCVTVCTALLNGTALTAEFLQSLQWRRTRVARLSLHALSPHFSLLSPDRSNFLCEQYLWREIRRDVGHFQSGGKLLQSRHRSVRG